MHYDRAQFCPQDHWPHFGARGRPALGITQGHVEKQTHYHLGFICSGYPQDVQRGGRDWFGVWPPAAQKLDLLYNGKYPDISVSRVSVRLTLVPLYFSSLSVKWGQCFLVSPVT